MNKNSFLHPIGELHFDTYLPNDAKEALEITEKLAKKRLNDLIAIPDQDRTFVNTLFALRHAQAELKMITDIICHYDSVLGKPWREAKSFATAISTRLSDAIIFDPNIYRALVELRKSPHYKKANKARRKLLDDSIISRELKGVHLPDDKKNRIKKIRRQLNKATLRFEENVVKARDSAGVHAQRIDDLAGVSKDLIAEAKKAAEAKGLKGYWVPYSEPNFARVMTDCHVAKTRESLYKTMRFHGLGSNKKLTQKILRLRNEYADILGFKTYADVATKRRMAGSGKNARDFIEELITLYRPGIEAEKVEVEAFARRYEKNPQFKLPIYESDNVQNFYYASRLRDEKFGLNEQEIREYFPFTAVLEGLFNILQILYGVSFKAIKTATWHPDVQVFAIYDENKMHIATVWCDWFARKGKHGGAWMDSLYVADRADGATDKPHLGYVCANIQPGVDGRPSLLTMREAETIWHEFGHFMHLALSRTELAEQSMMDCEWDFIEAPSQIMENWLWHEQTLPLITKHYKTNKPMSGDLIKKLVAARRFRACHRVGIQLSQALKDLRLHMDFANDATIDPVAVDHAVKKQIFGVQPKPYDLNIYAFTHIFAGGYAAGYYSYKWADAIQADFFGEFKPNPLSPDVGRRYRDKVLARGSELPAQQIVRDFLGRDSSTRAMLKRDGIL